MNEEQHLKYKGVQLTDDLVKMYTDLILNDDPTLKVFMEVGKFSDEDRLGLTIADLMERVTVNRRIRQKKKYIYDKGNIIRKHAERIVYALEMMGLCYKRQVLPSKVIRLTPRGKQIEHEIKARIKRMKSEKEKGDSNYVES